jgi:DNA processing protein
MQGRLDLPAQRSVAIVGSRHATAQGLDNARAFAAYLSEQDWTVVSGLALGIDGAAHEGALTGAGSTVAVVGTGLDQVYPKRHRALAQRIVEHGTIISEFALGALPLADHFPRRNRIIAGLSAGTLVVEAAVQSGSLITARLANEMGREVFAIPGSIKDGAKLVETGSDVLQELRWPATVPDASQVLDLAGGAEDELLAAMGYDPVSLDALSARTGWPAGKLSARLMALELEHKVARLPGALYQRRAAA